MAQARTNLKLNIHDNYKEILQELKTVQNSYQTTLYSGELNNFNASKNFLNDWFTFLTILSTIMDIVNVLSVVYILWSGFTYQKALIWVIHYLLSKVLGNYVDRNLEDMTEYLEYYQRIDKHILESFKHVEDVYPQITLNVNGQDLKIEAKQMVNGELHESSFMLNESGNEEILKSLMKIKTEKINKEEKEAIFHVEELNKFEDAKLEWVNI